MSRARAAERRRKAPSQRELQEQLLGNSADKYVLRLYVAGSNHYSLRAIENTRRLCTEFLLGRYELHVIDLYQQPTLAQRDRVVTVPVLVKVSPPPSTRCVGDMYDVAKTLRSLGIVINKKREQLSGTKKKQD